MNARLRRSVALTLMTVGLAAFTFGALPLVETISATWFYRHSPEAERAARPAALLDLREARASPAVSPAASPTVDASAQTRIPPGVATLGEGSSVSVAVAATPEAVPRYAGADELELGVAELRYDDPPEVGARARLVLEVHNRSELASTPLVVVIPTDWFGGYRLLGASPELIDDQISPQSTRLLTWPELAPGTSATLELHFTALDDDVTPPELRLLLADGAEVANPQVQVVGPRPRPGLARALTIPRLNIQSSVVQTVWEPPRFVVGQIQGSALLGEGNSVLVGHLTGPAGDVFARLDQLQTGDEVTAVSRGLAYKFVVSETLLRPSDDSSPMDPTATPRLTLMTCAGTWNPLTHDYSHRVWIVAEPPELAEATIAAQAEATIAAQAEATIAAQAEATIAAQAEATIAAQAEATIAAQAEATIAAQAEATIAAQAEATIAAQAEATIAAQAEATIAAQAEATIAAPAEATIAAPAEATIAAPAEATIAAPAEATIAAPAEATIAAPAEATIAAPAEATIAAPAEATIAAPAEAAVGLPPADDQPEPVGTPEVARASIPATPAPVPPRVAAALTPSQGAVPIASASVVLPTRSRLAVPSLERWRPLAVRHTAVRSAGRPAPAGLTIDAPLSRLRVPANLTVGGVLKRPRDLAVHAWLVVRALQPGGRWYLYPRELVAGSDGKWQAELTLGGSPGVRHELRVGVVDSETQAALTRQATTGPNQPLDALPPGFWPEAVRIVVRR